MASKTTGNAGQKASEENNPWADAGIEIQEIAVPYFAPDRKWQTATIVALRQPTKEEAWRKLDGRDPFPVYAIIDVLDKEGRECQWDISSKLLLATLRKTVHKVPMEIEVKTSGNPPRKTYDVRQYTPRLDVEAGEPAALARKYVNGQPVPA